MLRRKGFSLWWRCTVHTVTLLRGIVYSDAVLEGRSSGIDDFGPLSLHTVTECLHIACALPPVSWTSFLSGPRSLEAPRGTHAASSRSALALTVLAFPRRSSVLPKPRLQHTESLRSIRYPTCPPVTTGASLQLLWTRRMVWVGV